MNQGENEIRFALGVIDDHRRLIAAGKTQRWDIVKWAVTVNVALAAASAALRQQHVSAEKLFFLLAIVVFALAICLIWEVTRRMTATRNASLAPLKYLIDKQIDVHAVIREELPKKYERSYDWRTR